MSSGSIRPTSNVTDILRAWAMEHPNAIIKDAYEDDVVKGVLISIIYLPTKMYSDS